jgi:hypothetical protein
METELKLLTEIFRFSNLDVYDKGDDSSWFWSPADSFRHQDDALYIAVRSHFTQAHWDKWTFNEGAGALKNSDVRKDINSGNFDSVPGDLMHFTKGGPGLAARRTNEGIMFSTGQYNNCYAK